MYVYAYTHINTHMLISVTLQTYSQYIVGCSREIIGTAYLAFHRKKNKQEPLI